MLGSKRKSIEIEPAPLATIDDFSSEIIAIVLGFLTWQDALQARTCNKKWVEASKVAIIAPSEYIIGRYRMHERPVRRFGALYTMSNVLPGLTQIDLLDFDYPSRYNYGEDPDGEEEVIPLRYGVHDIQIISRFAKLRCLSLCDVSLNGRYPCLFNLPLLQKLHINDNRYKYSRGWDGRTKVKWDLELLAGLPHLKDLFVQGTKLSGNIKSLRILRRTLEKVKLNARDVVGNLMELADFPCLRTMDLDGTNVTGDVRDIKETDFTNLNEMFLSKSVYGSNVYCEFDCIADVPSVMQAWHRLSKRIPSLFEKIRQWYLDLESTDQYHSEYHNYGVDPPFYIEPVKVGPRLGWRWINYQKHPCKVNWLDPEPEIPSENDYGARVKYESYVRDLQDIELELQASPFKDCYLPTEEEYCRLSKEFDENRVFSDEEDDSCGE